jgi:hypothetical protein
VFRERSEIGFVPDENGHSLWQPSLQYGPKWDIVPTKIGRKRHKAIRAANESVNGYTDSRQLPFGVLRSDQVGEEGYDFVCDLFGSRYDAVPVDAIARMHRPT